MKKLRNKKGFTLTEMLIAVLLLGFVSVMVTVMTTAILNSTVIMREVAQAEILGSEALDNLQGQLRIAKKVTVANDEKNVTFDIDESNKNYTFRVEDGQIAIGQVKEGVFNGDTLFAGVSYGNLSVTKLQFSWNNEKKNVVEILIEISYGSKALWSGSVTVKPLNGVTIA